MSALFPEGIHDIKELPYTIWNAILAALTYLGYEELDKDERPPRAIWFTRKEMKAHFKRVEKARDAKFGGDKDIRDEEIEGPVSKNDTMELLGLKP